MQVVQGIHGEGEYGIVVEDDSSPDWPFRVSARVCISLHTACYSTVPASILLTTCIYK